MRILLCANKNSYFTSSKCYFSILVLLAADAGIKFLIEYMYLKEIGFAELLFAALASLNKKVKFALFAKIACNMYFFHSLSLFMFNCMLCIFFVLLLKKNSRDKIKK